MDGGTGRRLQELRRSNAATKHGDKRLKRERDRSNKERKAIMREQDQ